MSEDRGAICLVEHGGDIFLIRAVLHDGQRTGFYEYATSTGSGQPVQWRDALEGDGFAGLAPLVARHAPLKMLDYESFPCVSPELLETRAEFARRLKVDDGRVHQWVKSGQIGKDALHGRGSYARIKVQLALSQLRERRGKGWRKRMRQRATINAPPAALAASIASTLVAREGGEVPTDRLELPPGFIEAAAALWTGMQHEDPAGFLTTALQLHRAARDQ